MYPVITTKNTVLAIILVLAGNEMTKANNETVNVMDWVSMKRPRDGLRQAKHKQLPRQGKIINFVMDEDSHVVVELGFNVPFLQIPIKTGTPKNEHGQPEKKKSEALLTVNTAALVVAGVLATTVLFVVPALLKRPHNSFGRTDETENGPKMWKYVKELDTMLADNMIDSSACTHKSLCYMVKSNKDGIVGKTINKITGSWLVNNLLSGSHIQRAIETGKDENEDCREHYPTCPINRQHLDEIVNTLMAKFSTD